MLSQLDVNKGCRSNVNIRVTHAVWINTKITNTHTRFLFQNTLVILETIEKKWQDGEPTGHDKQILMTVGQTDAPRILPTEN